MARIRRTRRWSSSDVIVLAPNDKKDLNIEIGTDEVDIDKIAVIKKKVKKK